MEGEQGSPQGLSFDAQVALRIAQLSSDLVAVFDVASGCPTQVNDRLRSALGLGRDIAPAELSDRLHPDDATRLREQRHRAAALPDGATVYTEYRLRHSDGHWLWLRERAGVLTRGAGGRADRIICVARDITREMQAQEAIDAGTQRFSLALAASGVVLFSQDRELRYTWVHNPMPGFAVEKMLGRRDGDLTERPEDGLRMEAIKRRAMVERRRLVEDTCVHQAGRPVWWRLTVEPVLDRAGQVTGVSCAAHDITDQKRQREALAASEARWRTLADSVPMILWAVSADGVADDFNRQWEEYTGLSRAQSIGTGWRPALHPDDVAALGEAWSHGVEARAELRVKHRLRDRDGRWRWFQSVAVPVTEDDRIVRWYGSSADIDELERTEQDLVRAKQAADDANAAKDRFLATLSHELRTPLTPILLSTRILELKPDDRETVLGRAAVIRRSVETEVRLIDDLLDLTRISRDKLGLAAIPVSLHEVVAAAAEVCEADAQSAGVKLALDLAASACLVRGDAQRLQQVMWNLLKNAIKFSPRGGRVTVRTENAEPMTLSVSVRDQGIGIAVADLPRLFTPFEQGDIAITRQFGGLGLGLALVQRLVGLHGGAVHAESDGPGRGACFVVRLPLLPARVKSTTAPTPAPAPVVKPRAGGRVLLVEDDADTSHTLTALLRAAGWTVHAEHNAADALAAARLQRPDILVADLGLPDGDGCDLLAMLRQQGFISPAIALTGHGMDADQARTRAAGFARHFTKPVEVGDLLAEMDRLVAGTPAPAA